MANRSSSSSTLVRGEVCREWAEPARRCFELIGQSNLARRKRLYTRAVLAVVLVTFADAPIEAERFWRLVRDNDGLRVDDPARTLIEWLIDARLDSPSLMRASRGVAACWNAFYERRPLRMVKVIDPHGAIVIRGTRFDRGGRSRAQEAGQ